MRFLSWQFMDVASKTDADQKARWQVLLATVGEKHGDRWSKLLRAAVRQERRFSGKDEGAPLHSRHADLALVAAVSDAFGKETIEVV